jgi:uncharacterized phage protein (TIGR02218 family)
MMYITDNTALANPVSAVTTLATCWKLIRQDGVILGFTDHDCSLTLAGTTYQPLSGWTASAIACRSNMAIDHTEVEGILDAETITEHEMKAGLYDQAEVWIYRVNVRQPESSMWVIKRGWLGEIAWVSGRFVAEIRGISHRFATTEGALYSATCRARFGDNQCKIDLSQWTCTGVVDSVINDRSFLVLSQQELYADGILTFTSGNSLGKTYEVSDIQQNLITLLLAPTFAIQPGDSYRLIKGCDQRFSTCTDVFSNAINFRGEPHVPGMDTMLKTPSTR